MVIAHEFDYRRPASLEEAIGIISEYSGSVQILAGGTDLVAWLRDDAVAPDVLVDIKDVPGLRDIAVGDDALSMHAKCIKAPGALPRDLKFLQIRTPMDIRRTGLLN